MAKPRATPPHPAETEGRPLQRQDLDREGWKLATSRWAEMGNVASRIPGEIEKHQAAIANPNASPRTIKQSTRALNNLQDIQSRGLAVDRPITVSSAARRRVKFFDEGAARNRSEGDIVRGTPQAESPVGAGWYFEHAGEIKDISHIESARPSREDQSRLYHASGSMSPLNSPTSEKKALRGMTASQRADFPITPTTPEGAEAVDTKIGETTSFRALSPEQVGSVSSKAMEKHLDTRTPLSDIGQGGVNVGRGLGIVRGDIAPENFAARGPAGAPKLSGYIASTKGAGEATANEEAEYHRRVHEGSPGSGPYFQQPTVFGEQWEKDPYGEAQSRKGILDPGGATAEDTWMNAISYGQPHEMTTLETGKKSARLGKVIASDTHGLTSIPAGDVFPSSSLKTEHPVSPEAVLHALNQEATHSAARMVTRRAEKQGRNMGAGLPAVAMQEGAWEEYRVQAGKSDEYTAAVEERGRQAEFDKHGTTIHKGQRSLF